MPVIIQASRRQGAFGSAGLSNFTSKAPAEVVQQQRDRAADTEKQTQAIVEDLRGLCRA